MNTQKTGYKKKVLLIIFAILAAAFLAYTAVCDYAGISGSIEFLQKEFFHISRFLGVIEYPYWFIHGTISGMLAVLCIYGIYRMKSSKRRYICLALCLFLPYFVNAHFEPGSENLRFMTLIMAVFLAVMFSMANIPGIVDRYISGKLASQTYDSDCPEEIICRKTLHCLEWICFSPLKKALVGLLWLICFALGLLGIVAYFRKPETDFILIGLLFTAMAVFTVRKAWRYIKTPYHCMPVINKILSKEQMENLLKGEKFELVPFEDELLRKHTPILLSENWAVIEGLLVSRKLALRIEISGSVPPARRLYSIRITYLNGEQFKTRPTGLQLVGEPGDEMQSMLYKIAKIHFPVCAPEKIRQKYSSILPEIESLHDKLLYLLTNDVSAIKQEYESMFAPKTGTKKKSKRDR